MLMPALRLLAIVLAMATSVSVTLPPPSGGSEQSSPDQAPDPNSIKGTATFGNRPALPSDAVLIVQLRDLTRDADDAAAVLAEERIPLRGRKSPVSFVLRYDPSKIAAKIPSAISASIAGRGKLLFVLVKAVTIPDITNPTPVSLALSRATANKGQTPPVPEAPPHF
jgi:putative lipoprotein